MNAGAAILSDLHRFGRGSPPWLTVDIDHRFSHRAPGFHLRVAFRAHAARTAIFGPSGSGKSSVLRAIAGLLKPDAGEIQIHGQTVWRAGAKREHNRDIPVEDRRVGLVMQAPAIFPHLTVRRNVAFPLQNLGSAPQKEKVFELLKLVHAEALADRWPRELSGGQLQRIAIARTLAADPRILLLDEPFAALDARGRQELSDNLYAWANEHGVPVLTVTHNLEEAFVAADEVLILNDGRVTAQGPPHEVLAEERERLLRAMKAGSATG
jgi:molybdate transport system ATP-binding protein